MTKNGNDINSLIKEAIKASIDFEALMDSTDFDSYLLKEDEDVAVEYTTRYHDKLVNHSLIWRFITEKETRIRIIINKL